MRTLLLLGLVGVILAAFVSAKYTGSDDEDVDIKALLQQLEAADNEANMKRGLSDDDDDDDDDDEEIMKRVLSELENENENEDEDASQANAIGKKAWTRRWRWPRIPRIPRWPRIPRIPRWPRIPRIPRWPRIPRYPRWPYGKKK